MDDKLNSLILSTVLSKIQDAMKREDWGSFKLNFLYLQINFKKEADELWERIPENIRKTHLYNFHK